MPYGTYIVADLLATSRVGQSVMEVGEDNTYQAINNLLVAHNDILNNQLMGFVEPTTDRIVGVGGTDTMFMEDLDEFGRADAQKVSTGGQLGFPLRKQGAALQWTRQYLQNVTPAELVAQTQSAMTGDIVNVQRQIKRALFNPTNTTFVDKLVDRLSIPVKALVNADGMALPVGPNGENFNAGTHTHYLARAGGSLAASDISALILTVAEHYNAGGVVVYINQGQEAAIRAMTSNFTPYVDARIVVPATTQVARGDLTPANIYNRAIGVFDGAEVWTKPWVPAGYLYAWMQGQDAPLAMRNRRAGSGTFALDYDNEQYPLRAKQMSREFGIGVKNRVNGAVLYAGGTTYTAPVF